MEWIPPLSSFPAWDTSCSLGSSLMLSSVYKNVLLTPKHSDLDWTSLWSSRSLVLNAWRTGHPHGQWTFVTWIHECFWNPGMATGGPRAFSQRARGWGGIHRYHQILKWSLGPLPTAEMTVSVHLDQPLFKGWPEWCVNGLEVHRWTSPTLHVKSWKKSETVSSQGYS